MKLLIMIMYYCLITFLSFTTICKGYELPSLYKTIKEFYKCTGWVDVTGLSIEVDIKIEIELVVETIKTFLKKEVKVSYVYF